MMFIFEYLLCQIALRMKKCVVGRFELELIAISIPSFSMGRDMIASSWSRSVCGTMNMASPPARKPCAGPGGRAGESVLRG